MSREQVFDMGSMGSSTASSRLRRLAECSIGAAYWIHVLIYDTNLMEALEHIDHRTTSSSDV